MRKIQTDRDLLTSLCNELYKRIGGKNTIFELHEKTFEALMKPPKGYYKHFLAKKVKYPDLKQLLFLVDSDLDSLERCYRWAKKLLSFDGKVRLNQILYRAIPDSPDIKPMMDIKKTAILKPHIYMNYASKIIHVFDHSSLQCKNHIQQLQDALNSCISLLKLSREDEYMLLLMLRRIRIRIDECRKVLDENLSPGMNITCFSL